MPRIAILGATGSIGRQTLEVIDHLNTLEPGSWQVQSLAADNSIGELAGLARRYQPDVVACKATMAAQLGDLLEDTGIRVLSGEPGLVQLATEPEADIVLLAVYGLAAIAPLLAAVEAQKRIALASKEALVAAGRFVMEAARRRGASILPVDSEHSALFQLLESADGSVRSVTLTASGGPFFGRSRDELAGVTFEQAQQHPTWKMGAGITLNSATLFNKGLEVIEAHHLFGLPMEKIGVLVESTSSVHAMLELLDGSIVMHSGVPDMHVPIQFALTWPRRLATSVPGCNLTGRSLQFAAVDNVTFPALSACRTALASPWWVPAALVAANELLSEAFQRGKIPFLAIGDTLLQLAEAPDTLGLGAVEEQVFELTRVRQGVEAWLLELRR